MPALTGRERFSSGVDSNEQIDDFSDFSTYLRHLNLVGQELPAAPVLLKLLPIPMSGPLTWVIFWKGVLHREILLLEWLYACEHENRLKPLLSVQNVVDRNSIFFTSVQKNRWDRIPFQNGLDQFPTITDCPDALSLKSRLKV